MALAPPKAKFDVQITIDKNKLMFEDNFLCKIMLSSFKLMAKIAFILSRKVSRSTSLTLETCCEEILGTIHRTILKSDYLKRE